MPFKSKAQQRAMHAKAERGEISQKTIKEFDKSTDFSHLPEKVHHKKKHDKPGNTDFMVSRESPSSNNKDRVQDTIEGMGTIRDTKEGTAPQHLDMPSTYTEVKGTNTSKVEYHPVKIGGKSPKEYDPD